MNRANDITALVDDLAGHWTEPALEILKATGVHPVSVEMELETWQTLKRLLHFEIRWQRTFRFSTLLSLGTLMEQVLRRAVLIVAQKLDPKAISAEFESQVRRWAGSRRSTAVEGLLYADLVGEPALPAPFKPPSRMDFTPRLRISALSG